MGKKDSDLIVFVHTPKAAGTTVNAALATLGEGVAHIEKYQSNQVKFQKYAYESTWISGHLTIEKFELLLKDVPRNVRYFSCIREPHSHVRSHYNWLIEIFHMDENFYNSHPDAVKKISERIRASDRSQASSIIKNLRRHRPLFLNFQRRFVLGDEPLVDNADFEKRIAKFEYIGTLSRINTLLRAIDPTLSARKRENRSGYHFDPKVFETPAMKNFLERQNSLDIELFNRISHDNSGLKR